MKKNLSTPRSTFINNTSRHIIGNASRHAYTSKQLRAIYDHVKPTSLTNLPFGSIRRIRELRLNKKTRSRRNNTCQHLEPCRKDEIRNLRQVPAVDKNSDEIVQTMISTVNARSLKHKENLISVEMLNNNTEIVVITETWLKNTEEAHAWTLSSELNNYSHQILTKIRAHRRGGGIALVSQRKYKISREPENKDYESFEHDIWNIQIGPKSI